ncbi:MAG: glycosyltransferase family 39 protein [Rhizonema sp. PD37]|nr:glycosyltransferase family 39 protein [Rhizonema sp. PD37]
MEVTTNTHHNFSKRLFPKGLRLFIVVLLLIGVFFRFVNLERKVYWHDEAYTGLRISGYTKKEFVHQVFNGRVIGVQSFQKYQYPNLEKGTIDTINSLAREEPQHSPLYYVMERWWVQLFGNSVAVTRSLSAIISLLAFPCTYWLCWELFDSQLPGWIAVALLSVSPIHVLYAQEAREYSLWTVTILLSSATLLRAMRLGSRQLWNIYALTVALGLYTFLFSSFVTIAHGVYVFAIERRFTKTAKSYLVGTSAGFIAFIPWILIIIINFTQVESATASAQQKQSFSALLTNWISNISSTFGDFWRYEPFFPSWQIPGLHWGRYLIPLILILVGYSFFFISRYTTKPVWLFVFTLSGVPALALILPDLIIGGELSVRARYVFPCYISIQLALTYLLTTQIFSNKLLRRKFWQLVMVVVIICGVVSCAISSQADTWWNKGSHANPQIALIINNSVKPLLISSTYSLNIGDLMSLSHLLDDKVKMLLGGERSLPQIPEGFSDIFLYNPSKKFKSKLEKFFKIDTIYEYGRLLRIDY